MQRSNDRHAKVSTEDRPDSFDTLKQTITDHYDGLSRRLQEVGEYALANPDEMALETIAVIASRARVPPSSLIRFSKALGFEGFTEMQRLFRERLVAHAPTYGERIMRLRDRQDGDGGTMASSMLDDFSTAGIEGLERLRQDLPQARLEAAIELLSRASLIHVVGQRRAFPVASYLAYLLSELGCRAALLDGAGGMLLQQSRFLDESSTLVAVSFRPYAPDVIALVERCHENGGADHRHHRRPAQPACTSCPGEPGGGGKRGAEFSPAQRLNVPVAGACGLPWSSPCDGSGLRFFRFGRL